MKVLHAALMNRFLASTVLAGLVNNRLYFGIAPQDEQGNVNCPRPYIVMNEVGDVMSRTFTEEQDNMVIQFNIFADDYDDAQAIFEVMKGDANHTVGFDYAGLSVSGYVTSTMARESSVGPFFNNKVWQITVTYSVATEKSR